MIVKEKNQFKIFAVRGIVFLVIFFTIDFTIGSLVKISYFSQKNKYTYGIQQVNSEIIITGSSRAEHHYIPSVISDELNLSCYNMGFGGQNIYFHYGIISSLLERYYPKIIIMELFYIDYSKTDSRHDKDKLSILLPFYNKNRAIKEIIDMRGWVEKIKLTSKIYPFNSQIYSIIFSFLKNENNPTLISDGYVPLYGEISSSIKYAEKTVDFELDTIKISYIKKVISMCKQKNIRLIIVNSPILVNMDGAYESFQIICNIGKDTGIEVWNYENDTSFLKHEYFKDLVHLNNIGAYKFSKGIANRIKNDKYNTISH
jgi:hypothetical protein